MSRGSHRVEFTCGYLLHQRPYRDTSLIVELYTREHGRLSAFARAARGPRSRFRGLQPFRPLLLSWVGRGEAPTLTAAEGDGQLSPTGNVDAQAGLVNESCHGPAEEGLGGVRRAIWERASHVRAALAQMVLVVDDQRRAVLRGERGDRDSANHQAALRRPG